MARELKMLRRGATGDDVRTLQQALKRAGLDPGPEDGIFGPLVDAAVRSFQGSKGLTVDGIVGPLTWAALCIPDFDPSFWNDADGIQFNNNCYNYATNTRTDTFAQPGTGSGNPFANTACADVDQAARSDGLTSTSCDDPECTGCCHQVALVIWPGQDFHWYRRDRDGSWSHKPGSTQARNVDNSNNPITDPRTANRGPYTDFCGCYCVCRDKVTIG